MSLPDFDLEFQPLTADRWPDFEKLFGEPGAVGGCWCMCGIHLLPPGYDEDGSTLETFAYNKQEERGPLATNRQGLAHLACAVEDVEAARCRVRYTGGQDVGDIVSWEISGAGHVTFACVTEAEGSIIELQRWAQEKGDTLSKETVG